MVAKFLNRSLTINFARSMQLIEAQSENNATFASQIQEMGEDLEKSFKVYEGTRKDLKHRSASEEKRVAELEAAAEKARVKYESAREDLRRAQGIVSGAEVDKKLPFNAKKKSGDKLQRQEAEARDRSAVAKDDWGVKADAAHSAREVLQMSQRPKTIKELRQLLGEVEATLAFHIQKFAALTERLAVVQGSTIVPVNSSRDGLSQLAKKIEIDNDFRNYVLTWKEKVPQTQLKMPSAETPTTEVIVYFVRV